MNILVAGRYETDYNRTRILLKGLKKLGVHIAEYNYSGKRFDKELFKSLDNQADFVFVPSFRHVDVPEIKKNSEKPVIFDPLISKYMTKVFDYKDVSRFSPRALKNRWKDIRAMRLADIVLADTNAHKNYFIERLGITGTKIEVLPIGIDESECIASSGFHRKEKIVVGFYGGFNPLQGTSKILDAIKLLNPEIYQFVIVGDGFEYSDFLKKIEKEGLENVELTGRVPYPSMIELIKSWDICLGIFGNTIKSQVVIPNKIYHYAGMSKPIITLDTPAIKEIFTHSSNIWLVDGNPSALAGAIEKIANNEELAMKLGVEAGELIMQNFTDKEIARQLLRILEKK